MQQGRPCCLSQWLDLEDIGFSMGKKDVGRRFQVSSLTESDEDYGVAGRWAWGRSPADEPQ